MLGTNKYATRKMQSITVTEPTILVNEATARKSLIYSPSIGTVYTQS